MNLETTLQDLTLNFMHVYDTLQFTSPFALHVVSNGICNLHYRVCVACEKDNVGKSRPRLFDIGPKILEVGRESARKPTKCYKLWDSKGVNCSFDLFFQYMKSSS